MALINDKNQNWVEMAILCNMIVNQSICEIALSQLQEDYFVDERNRIIFRTIRLLDNVQTGKRFETMTGILERQGLLEAAGGKGYITCVYLFVPEGDVDGFMQLLIPKAA